MAKKTAKGKSPKVTKPKSSAPKAEPPALVPGTVLRKLDRKGKPRCECTVEAEGYRYKGTVCGSLSRAAAAAAKDLRLAGKSFNGYVFWGLTRPGHATGSPRAPVEPLQLGGPCHAQECREGRGIGARQAASGADKGRRSVVRSAGPAPVDSVRF